MIPTTGYHLRLGVGMPVDFSREVAPGLTLEKALGDHAAGFTPVVDETAGRAKAPKASALDTVTDVKE